MPAVSLIPDHIAADDSRGSEYYSSEDWKNKWKCIVLMTRYGIKGIRPKHLRGKGIAKLLRRRRK